MAQHYAKSELAEVGKQCGNRLPPASAMQAMFLYEMQRETESEKLFQGQVFRLAKAEAYSASLEQRLLVLEERFGALQKQATAKDVDERVATSKIHIDALSGKLNNHTKRLDSHAQRLTTTEERFDGIDAVINSTKIDVNRHTRDINDMKMQPSTPSKRSNGPKQGLDDLDHDVSILFDERDALASQLSEVNERTAILEAQVEESITKVEQKWVCEARQRCNEQTTEVKNQANKAIAAVAEVYQRIDSSVQQLADRVGTSTDRIREQVNNSQVQIAETKDQIQKLSGLVRALTGQNVNSSRGPSQLLPVQTPNGENINLSVPKGQSFAFSPKEFQNPFRSFTPR